MKVSRSGKKFLAPSEKYEIWLQLVRQETTIAGAASAAGVDRTEGPPLWRTPRVGGCHVKFERQWRFQEASVLG